MPGAGYEALHPELKGLNPEDYPDIHKLRILSDVAPYSREYNQVPSSCANQNPRARARRVGAASASVHSFQSLADGDQQPVFESRITDRTLQKMLRYPAGNINQFQLLLALKQDEGMFVDHELHCG